MARKLMALGALHVAAFLAVAVQGDVSSAAASRGQVAWSWSLLDVAGAKPTARQGHASVAIGRKIFVFGGCVQEIKCFNDLHSLDTGSNEWAEEFTSGDLPEPRGGHTATLVGTDVYVFGGANTEASFDDVHKLDLRHMRWSRVPLASDSSRPAARTNHAAAAEANGRLYVFGGYSDDGGKFLNDLWQLELLSPSEEATAAAGKARWTRLATEGQVPVAREGHSLTVAGLQLVVVGGYTVEGHSTNDVHTFDLQQRTWHRLDVPKPLPPPRQAHSAARHGREIVVAGGCDLSEARPVCFNDAWGLDLSTGRWRQRSSAVPRWQAREGNSASFVEGKMFLFGGCQIGSSCFSDVAVLDTLDPCAANCGGHGTCVGGQFCQCTAPGFTGSDCQQPLACAVACGSHGSCSRDGRSCDCKVGWGGALCSVAMPTCPGRGAACSGHGMCLANATCHCDQGFGGKDCAEAQLALPLEVLAGFAPGSGAGSGLVVQSLVAVSAGRLLSPAIGPKLQVSGPPTVRAFGIDKINENGHVAGGSDMPLCKENCNFRGLCEKGTCFCQPGFSGDTCGVAREPVEGTLSIGATLAVAGAALGLAFIAAFITSLCIQQKKRALERETGYRV